MGDDQLWGDAVSKADVAKMIDDSAAAMRKLEGYATLSPREQKRLIAANARDAKKAARKARKKSVRQGKVEVGKVQKQAAKKVKQAKAKQAKNQKKKRGK